MKTLDEVIEKCQENVNLVNRGEWEEDCFLSHEYMVDALHYLKDMKNLERDYDILYNKYWREFNQQQTNPALTWDELKQMEGKPVWVESHGDITEFVGWAIVKDIRPEDRVNFILSKYEGNGFYALEIGVLKAMMGIEWQAYRKERV